MKKEKLYLLFLLTWLMASCQTPSAREISNYVGRPAFEAPCISNGDGTCFREGGLENDLNYLSTHPDEFARLNDYLEDLERRLYICLKYKRRCK